MTRVRYLGAPIVAGALVSVWACGPQPRPVETPQPPRADLILLLPSPDGTTGHAVVSNPAGQIDLDQTREYTRVVASQAPSSPIVMSEEEVARQFGDVLAALPPAAEHFTLNFRFESDELTPESRALVSRILEAVRKRPVPEVAVIGHTDTSGTAAGNYQLGLKRAQTVRGLLLAEGLAKELVMVTSHGEGDLLVPTADEVLEPRNRRVEITIR
jgi:outer membrane protein OmpA-like peptidoglycan-associated protein